MSTVLAPSAETIREAAVQLLLPYRLRKLSLFGSFARGDSGADSDIDLLVELQPEGARQLDLIAWVGLERRLSEALGAPVEMVRPQALNPRLRPYIEQDLVVLYEAA